MSGMKVWLEDLGLAQHYQMFLDNDIDMSVMRLLAEGDLEQLGLSLGHRKRLLKGIAELAAAESAAATTLAVDPMLASERRQLTVLFCDMVGFTELANRVDPEVLNGVVRRYEAECVIASPW